VNETRAHTMGKTVSPSGGQDKNLHVSGNREVIFSNSSLALRQLPRPSQPIAADNWKLSGRFNDGFTEQRSISAFAPKPQETGCWLTRDSKRNWRIHRNGDRRDPLARRPLLGGVHMLALRSIKQRDNHPNINRERPIFSALPFHIE